jgi:hypothetical protein
MAFDRKRTMQDACTGYTTRGERREVRFSPDVGPYAACLHGPRVAAL